jgi:hypothetical protein
MSNQAAAVPTPTPPATQAAVPPAQTTPAANTQTPAEVRRTAFLAAYDILRPAGEVDARAQRVLVTALVLIALCVVPQKPTTFSFGGLSFSLRHWLALAIPLCIVLLYTMTEFAVAWRIQWKRVTLILGGSIMSVQKQTHDDLEPLIARGRAFLEEQDVMEAKRKEIFAAYQERLDKIYAENLASEHEERFPGDSFLQRVRNYDAAREEWKQREQEAGITAFEHRRDELLRTGLDQNNRLLRQNQQAIAEMQRLLELKKLRLVMGLVVPVLLAAFALLIFAWAIHAA